MKNLEPFYSTSTLYHLGGGKGSNDVHLGGGKGLALIVVISVLAVMAIMAISFAFTMRLEVKMARNYLDATRARYLTEAGIAHARALLKGDKEDVSHNRYDYYPDELWRTEFSGDEVDNDGDGVPDSRWIEVTGTDGAVMGRYAILVKDEASKIDINCAGNLPGEEGWTTFEISFKEFLDGVDEGGDDHQLIADRLVSYRWGSDGKPGTELDDDGDNAIISNDGIDNDADGFRDNEAGEGESEGINEPDEFRVEYPYGDDRPFVTSEEIRRVAEIEHIFDKIRNLITVYSKDGNINLNYANRWNVNTFQTPQELYTILDEVGVSQPEQLACNILDFKDRDCARSELVLGEEKYYGVEGVRINEIMVSPKLDVNAIDASDISEGAWKWVQGQGHYKNSTYENPALGEGSWEWTGLADGKYYLIIYGESDQYVGEVYVDGDSQLIRHGNIFATPIEVEGGSFKLEIQHLGIKGITCYFRAIELSQQPDLEFIELVNLTPKEVEVGDWIIEGPQSRGWTATIPRLRPDGSPVVLGPGWYLVLAVDKYAKNLAPAPEISGIANNGISFEDTWGGYLEDVIKADIDEACCQLDFSRGVVSTEALFGDPPQEGDFITLRDEDGHIVDQVEYLGGQAGCFQSIEKGDPTYISDQNFNWVNDYWERATRVLEGSSDRIKGTPAMVNDNPGMEGGAGEIAIVKNNPFAGVGGISEVSTSSEPWQTVGIDEVKKLSDRLTTFGLRLEAEGRDVDRGGWDESLRDPPDTHWFVSETWSDEGIWRWDEKDGLANGVYILQVYGSEGEAISISVHQTREAGSDWLKLPMSTPGVDNGVQFGVIEVGGTDNPFSIYDVTTPNQTMEIRVRNEVIAPPEEKAIAHFDYITLCPISYIRGKININTAPKEVLCSLPGITEEIVASITTNRPYGKGDLSFGIGDLLEGDILIPDIPPETPQAEKEATKLARFKAISNLITVASDVYEITATSQILREGEVWAEKKLRVVVER